VVPKWFLAIGDSKLYFHVTSRPAHRSFCPGRPLPRAGHRGITSLWSRSGGSVSIYRNGVLAGFAGRLTAIMPNPVAPLTIGQARTWAASWPHGRVPSIIGHSFQQELLNIHAAGSKRPKLTCSDSTPTTAEMISFDLNAASTDSQAVCNYTSISAMAKWANILPFLNCPDRTGSCLSTAEFEDIFIAQIRNWAGSHDKKPQYIILFPDLLAHRPDTNVPWWWQPYGSQHRELQNRLRRSSSVADQWVQQSLPSI